MPLLSRINSAVAKFRAFVADHPIESALVAGIFLAAAIFRFYRVPAYMPFGGDEGRDALIVKALLLHHRLPLLGPSTSVGQLALGPLYYYMMAVPMALWWLNPIGPVIQVGVMSLVAGAILYWLARRWFGVGPALVALSLYSVSDELILYAHGSINAHPAPLLAMVAVLGVDQFKRRGNGLWLILTSGAVGAIIQTHYMALLFVPVIVLITIIAAQRATKPRHRVVIGLLVSLVVLVMMFIPMMAYDLSHHAQNLRAFMAILQGRGEGQSGQGLNLAALGSHVMVIYRDKLIAPYLGASRPWLTKMVAAIFILIAVGWAVLVGRRRLPRWPLVVVSSWLVMAIVGAALYQQVTYAYYFEFVAPALFLTVAAGVALARGLDGRNRLAAQAAALMAAAVIVAINLRHSPLLVPPGRSLAATQAIDHYILAQTHGQPYRLVLLANGNYEAGYHFFLEQYGQAPAVDPLLYADLKAPPVQSNIKHLAVICELPQCDPFDSSNVVIRSFGSGRVDALQHFVADQKSSSGGTTVYYLSR